MSEPIGKVIERLRISAGYNTLGELYRASNGGVSVATLSRIESGVQKPRPETLKTLAPFLRVTYEHLLKEAGYLDKNGLGVEDTNLQPTPPERIKTFYRKIGQLGPESLKLLEEQVDYLLRLERQIVERKQRERNQSK